MSAPRYEITKFFGQSGSKYFTQDAHAVVAVYRLGTPVSYDRSEEKSVSTQPTDGISARSDGPDLLLIHDDIISVTVDRPKSNHVKTAEVRVKGKTSRILRDVLSGDWIMIWLLPNKPRFDDLLTRINKKDACNNPEDGLRMVGRVHQVRKKLDTLTNGMKEVSYSIQAVGFSEFDSTLYYDMAIATNDLLQASVGGWLARIGVDAEALFAQLGKDRKDNCGPILEKLLDIVLGRGVSKEINPGTEEGLVAAAGAGAGPTAPNAYIIPGVIGKLLGIDNSNSVMSFADILTPLFGIQKYGHGTNDLSAFDPDVDDVTGTFLPIFPQLINTPFWEVLQHFLNPSVNEMYTCLRHTEDGGVLPHLIVRQIPFTTDAFDAKRTKHTAQARGIGRREGPGAVNGEDPDPPLPPASSSSIKVTKFSSLPRWVVPSTLVISADIGRSDATRTNLVHVYGSALTMAANNSVTNQLVEAPPIRDDLDIQRSGPRPLIQTVECAVDSQHDAEARRWMELIADFTMGSQLTLNGIFECIGLPGPICEGDNIEIDNMIYHIESLADQYTIAGDGKKRWRTLVRVTNGVLAKAGPNGTSYYAIDDLEELTFDKSDPGETHIGKHDVKPSGEFQLIED